MNMKKVLSLAVAALVALTPALAFAEESVSLTGAGASFPYPLYSKWISVYQEKNPGIFINYQSIGSGGGIKQISARTVDFGATDAPMSAKEMEGAQNTKIFHIPATMGAVAIGYNIPGVANLKLSQKALVGIYLGKIKMWNDPAIQATNDGIVLPTAPIVVVRRSEGSGTTDIFTDFLSKVSLEWKAAVGRGKSVSWPVGIGAKGNEGVSGVVSRTPFSIGYMNLAYCVQNNIPVAAIENKSGSYILPSAESASKAASGIKIPDNFKVSLVNSPNAEAYPITGFTWILIYKKQTDPVKGKAVVDFLRWAVTEGQQYSSELYYAPLSAEVVEMVQAKLNQVEL
jgi:phosphate transport system substrate-binding protein